MSSRVYQLTRLSVLKERYDAKIVYENLEAKTIDNVSVRVATVAAFDAALPPL
jgi:hypothetical protein